MYEERYIAFIDILGFKNIVTNTFNFPEEFNRLDQTLSYLESLKRKNYHDPWGNKWMGMEFTMFSDSIVISYPATGVKSKFVCKFIFQLCGFIYATFIFKRFD